MNRISPFKGKHHTTEAKEKNRLAHLGKPSWNKGLIGIMKPNAGSFKKGQIPWNKGVKGIHFSPSTEWQKGRNPNHSKETLQKIALAKLGKDRGIVFKLKIAAIHKEQWKNVEYARKIFRAQQRSYNNDEKYLDAILQLNFPNEWKYVGDGQITIEGKIPDFINCNGKKIVIEYNGFCPKAGFGHTLEKDQVKTEHYAKYGFRTLNLYKDDIENENKIIEKIRQFNAQ